jgi:hypothetical protein
MAKRQKNRQDNGQKKNRQDNGQKTEEQTRQWPKDRRTDKTMAKRQKNRQDNGQKKNRQDNGQKTEEQTRQWPKEKGQNDEQRSTKHTHKNIKDRETRTPLRTVGYLGCSGRVGSSCSIVSIIK